MYSVVRCISERFGCGGKLLPVKVWDRIVSSTGRVPKMCFYFTLFLMYGRV